MTRIVFAIYRPFKGKEPELLSLVKEHLPVLKSQNLITERKPIIMRASDGCIIEVFEWKSAQAIEEAHHNAAVQDLWMRFSKVCDYEKPVNVDEFHNLFSEFEALDL